MKRIALALLIVLSMIIFFGCDQQTTKITTTTQTVTTTATTAYQETTTSQVFTTTNLVTTSLDYTGIEVNQTERFFRIDESFDKSSIQVTAFLNNGTEESINSDLVAIRGYDSSSPGSKTVSIIFQQFLVQIEVYILQDYAIEIDMDYYQEALNLYGNTLLIKLNNIINSDLTPLLYGDARDILQESDEDPNNPDNIILVYTGNSVDSTWDGGTTWNREHTWPQSRLGERVSYVKDTPSRATDLHNLKPADPNENKYRSNDYFGTISSDYIYVPRDEVKGDVARILFYMATMYTDLTLNNDAYSDSQDNTMGLLSVLLEWNESDPVDDFERNRNNVIYSYQGNRNPFIDYPEFAELIWGDIA